MNGWPCGHRSGDRVTSPLLVGEWEIAQEEGPLIRGERAAWIRPVRPPAGYAMGTIPWPLSDLTPVHPRVMVPMPTQQELVDMLRAINIKGYSYLDLADRITVHLWPEHRPPFPQDVL